LEHPPGIRKCWQTPAASTHILVESQLRQYTTTGLAAQKSALGKNDKTLCGAAARGMIVRPRLKISGEIWLNDDATGILKRDSREQSTIDWSGN
jgi:hypothetical protein